MRWERGNRKTSGETLAKNETFYDFQFTNFSYLVGFIIASAINRTSVHWCWKWPLCQQFQHHCLLIFPTPSSMLPLSLSYQPSLDLLFSFPFRCCCGKRLSFHEQCHELRMYFHHHFKCNTSTQVLLLLSAFTSRTDGTQKPFTTDAAGFHSFVCSLRLTRLLRRWGESPITSHHTFVSITISRRILKFELLNIVSVERQRPTRILERSKRSQKKYT